MPVLLMLSPERVATPATAVTLVVPARVPLPGLVPIATVTLPANPVAVLPCASRAVSCTAGAIVAPAVVVLGWTVKTSCVAAPAVTLKAVLVAPVRPVAAPVRVYPVPVLLMLSPENVATPLAAATVAVPESVPPPALVPIATVMLPVNPVAVLPWASRAVTCTAGTIVPSAVVVLGCTVNASCAAGPGVMLKPALLAVVTPGPAAVSV